MQAVLNASKANNLWFADLSFNKKSKVMEICSEIGMNCKILTSYNPDNSSIDDYVHKKLRGAARSGMSAIILPLTLESVQKVKTMKEKTAAQSSMNESMEKLIRLLETSPEIIEPILKMGEIMSGKDKEQQ